MADGDKKKSDGLFNQVGKTLEELFGEFTSQFSTKTIGETVMQVDKAAFEVAQKFGVGKENILAIKAGLADAAVRVKELGGEFSNVQSIQIATSAELGRNVILEEDSIAKLYATTKVTGQEVSTMTKNFKDIGISTYDITKNMEKVVGVAGEIGVSAVKVSDQVVSNLSLLNKYNFQGGVEGLAKMAAQAVNLRISVVEMSNTLSAAFDPERAIDMAAALQRLGATQSDLLDPLRLMDLAQNDPAELQNQIAELSKQFVRLNKEGNFEILPGEKRRLQEIASAMGMNVDTLSRMALGSAELENKMQKIRFPSDIATEDDKKLIANMSEMKDGVAKIKFERDGKVQEKLVSELSKEDIKAIKETSEKAPKTMEDYAKSQLDALKAIESSLAGIQKIPFAAAGTKATDDILKLARTTVEAPSQFLGGITGKDTQSLRIALDKGTNEFTGAVNKLLKGEGSLTDLGDTVMKLVGDLKTGLSQTLPDSYKKMKETFGTLKTENNMYAEILENLVDFVKTKINESMGGKQKVEIKPETQNVNKTHNLQLTKNENQQPTEMKHTASVDLNIKIESSPNIDTSQLMLAINTPEVREQIVHSVNTAVTSNGMNGTLNPIERRKNIQNGTMEA